MDTGDLLVRVAVLIGVCVVVVLVLGGYMLGPDDP
jgi:hypothetical protein